MPKTCLIIPCYNEAARLDQKAFAAFLAEQPEYHLCFADDGSTDHTHSLLLKMQAENPGRVWIVHQPVNRGKAEAIREAVCLMHQQGQFDYLGYFDADLSTPLQEALVYYHLLNTQKALLIVFGSRMKKNDNQIEKNYLRHIGGRLFSAFINHYLKIKLYDTQCGAKLFKKELVTVAFEKPFASRWLFDIEIILRLQEAYNNIDNRLTEISVTTWINKKGSKIRWKDLLHMPLELRYIKKHYQGKQK